MPYIQVQDIRQGMDRKRKQRVVGEQGTAWTIINGHLTRGGDIERRKKFVKQPGSFPDTTSGLYAVGDVLYTTGYDSSEVNNVPAGITHLLTQNPNGAGIAIDRTLDAEGFDGILYSVVKFVDGEIHHYYGETLVTDWDTIAESFGSNEAIASSLASLINKSPDVGATSVGSVVTIISSLPGTSFTISQGTVDNGGTNDQTITLNEEQVNVVPVSEVLASADVTITGGTANSGVNNIRGISINGVQTFIGATETVAVGSFDINYLGADTTLNTLKVNGVDIISGPTTIVTSGSNRAAPVATAINSYTSSPNYTATASNGKVTVSAAAGTGTAPNGYVITGTTGVISNIVNMAGGAYGGVTWTTSNSNTAALVAAQINSHTSSPDYSATVSGATITITAAAGSGASANGLSVSVSKSGNVTETHETTLSGGVNAIAGVAQVYTATIGGTFESNDEFTITINGIDYKTVGTQPGKGTSVMTYKSKVYSVVLSNLYFSALNDPTRWLSGTDYGFINMSSQVSGQETLVATETYQGLMAIFSENDIRIWSISEDSTANVYIQTLQNTGTIAPASVTAYGNNDVFYLSGSGIRSIKARDSSNAAYISDVGTPIDTHVREFLNTLTNDEKKMAIGIIEPIDGRFWMAIKNRIYVLSYFPSAKISAFSYYDVEFDVKNIAKVKDKVYIRGTADDGIDYLYIYGGLDGTVFPDENEVICTIELPYFSAGDPAGNKMLIGFDIIGINNWKVNLLPDPNDESVIIPLGITTNVTYGEPRYGLQDMTPMFALTLTCSEAGEATMSALAMHYDGPFDGG